MLEPENFYGVICVYLKFSNGSFATYLSCLKIDWLKTDKNLYGVAKVLFLLKGVNVAS